MSNQEYSTAVIKAKPNRPYSKNKVMQLRKNKLGNAVSLFSIMMRGIAAGGAIGLSVWIAGLGLPFISGVVSVFPAIFLTTMVSLWLAQGRAVPVGATGPMMLGSSSVSIYALICILLFPLYGVWVGSIVCWLLSVIFYSVPIGVWTWRTIDV